MVLLYYLCSYGESCFLFSWCAGGKCDMAAATRIAVGVGDLVQRTGDGQAHVEYSVAGRSKGRATPCAVCTVHVETRIVIFFVEPQNQGRVSWLSLKIKVNGFSIWTSKLTALIW
jgi:hypothetical protein